MMPAHGLTSDSLDERDLLAAVRRGEPSGMTPELVSLLPVHGAGSGPWAFDRWSCVPCASRWTLRVRCIHGRGHGRTRRLVVLPTEVVNAADRRTVSEGAVGPVSVVLLEP